MDERRRHWRGPRHPATCTCVECNRARIDKTPPPLSKAEGDRRRAETLERAHQRDREQAEEFKRWAKEREERNSQPSESQEEPRYASIRLREEAARRVRFERIEQQKRSGEILDQALRPGIGDTPTVEQPDSEQIRRLEQFRAEADRERTKRRAGPLATVLTIVALAAVIAVVITAGALLA